MSGQIVGIAPLLVVTNRDRRRLARLTRTNPKSLCGQKKPPAHMADVPPRHHFRPERTTDRRGPAWDLSTDHSAYPCAPLPVVTNRAPR